MAMHAAAICRDAAKLLPRGQPGSDLHRGNGPQPTELRLAPQENQLYEVEDFASNIRLYRKFARPNSNMNSLKKFL